MPNQCPTRHGRLGEILLEKGLIDEGQLRAALEHQKANSVMLGTSLVKLGFLDESQVMGALSQQHGLAAVDLAECEIDPNILRLVPVEMAMKHKVMPISRSGPVLRLAMVDPTNVLAIDEIKFRTGFNIDPVVSTETALEDAIRKHYGDVADREHEKELVGINSLIDEAQAESLELEIEDEGALSLEQEELEKAADAAPVVRLVDFILADAVKKGASDIHMEPFEKEYRVRYRIDGVLQNVISPPLRLRDAIISRVKIMAKLDIAERRLPQDGRLIVKVVKDGKKRQLDLRVSVLPSLRGEKIVMRLLDKDNLQLDMTKLGFEAESLEKVQRAIAKPFGMVLVTGPTGSGKTNTLYSAISQLNTPGTNIVTAEDPVEFEMPGITQVQMKDQIGLNFAQALRSFLRQDPNIILVGEIRDFETAEIAIKAALTGHLVLSTLHTNDAPSTISRLMNMGVEPFLVATSVHLICAQRLVRKICQRCRVEDEEFAGKLLMDAGFTQEETEHVKVYKGTGCPACDGKGYKGRTGLYEVLEVTDEIRDLILTGSPANEIRRKAVDQGMLSLRRSGLVKAAAGVTTLEEVYRETVR
jgi:type IV pilus assembly protein PilB